MYTVAVRANLPQTSGSIAWPTPFAKPDNTTVSGSNTFDLRGVSPFYKGDFGFPGSTDKVLLDQNSSGSFFAGLGNDTFDYGSTPGTKNAQLIGGAGDDTFAISGLNLSDALKALKDNGYTFVMNRNGFSLRTKDGQEIRVREVEKIAFKDATLNLFSKDDLNKLIKGLKDAGVPIEDRTFRRPAYGYGGGLQNCGCSNRGYNFDTASLFGQPAYGSSNLSSNPFDSAFDYNSYGSGLQTQSLGDFDLSGSTNSLNFGNNYSYPVWINQNNYGNYGLNGASLTF
jgi:hypothetical protein